MSREFSDDEFPAVWRARYALPCRCAKGTAPTVHMFTRARVRARVLAHFLLPALVLLTGTGGARADDRADLERTRIVGNRELPKVLYIVPWKKPAPGDLAGRPMQSILDEALAPIDRDVFRRQLRYDAQMAAPAVRGEGLPAVTAPAPGAGQR